MKVAKLHKYTSSVIKDAPEPWHVVVDNNWEMDQFGHQIMRCNLLCGKEITLKFHDKKKPDKIEAFDKDKHQKSMCGACAGVVKRRRAEMRARSLAHAQQSRIAA